MARPPPWSRRARRGGTHRGQTSGVGGIEDSLEALAGRLEEIAAELDDLGFEHLREAAGGGDPAHLATERRLVRARRAVARAVAILRTGEGDGFPGT